MNVNYGTSMKQNFDSIKVLDLYRGHSGNVYPISDVVLGLDIKFLENLIGLIFSKEINL